MRREQAFFFLLQLFLMKGSLRLRNRKKLQKFGSQSYKKGFEIRLVAQSHSELGEIRKAIRLLDLPVAKPFKKRGSLIQPLYGKDIVLEFENCRKEFLRKK